MHRGAARYNSAVAVSLAAGRRTPVVDGWNGIAGHRGHVFPKGRGRHWAVFSAPIARRLKNTLPDTVRATLSQVNEKQP